MLVLVFINFFIGLVGGGTNNNKKINFCTLSSIVINFFYGNDNNVRSSISVLLIDIILESTVTFCLDRTNSSQLCLTWPPEVSNRLELLLRRGLFRDGSTILTV